MSRHAARWGLKNILASAGVTIILGGIVTAPIVASPIVSAHAAATSSGPTSSPDENNWG